MLSKKYAEVDCNICVACGACLKECPKSAIQVVRGCYAEVEQEICIGCGKCTKVCPTGCIGLRKREAKKHEK